MIIKIHEIYIIHIWREINICFVVRIFDLPNASSCVSCHVSRYSNPQVLINILAHLYLAWFVDPLGYKRNLSIYDAYMGHLGNANRLSLFKAHMCDARVYMAIKVRNSVPQRMHWNQVTIVDAVFKLLLNGYLVMHVCSLWQFSYKKYMAIPGGVVDYVTAWLIRTTLYGTFLYYQFLMAPI